MQGASQGWKDSSEDVSLLQSSAFPWSQPWAPTCVLVLPAAHPSLLPWTGVWILWKGHIPPQTCCHPLTIPHLTSKSLFPNIPFFFSLISGKGRIASQGCLTISSIPWMSHSSQDPQLPVPLLRMQLRSFEIYFFSF